jgi:hypothetical protein
MTRGDASNPRKHDVRVRLNDAEYALWDAARVRSGRREMGAWVRAVVTEVLTGQRAPARPGDLPRVVLPEANRDAVEQLRRVGNNLNQLAHRANADGHAPAVVELRRLLVEVEDALREVRGQRPVRVLAPPPVSTDRPPALLVDEHQVDEHQALDEHQGDERVPRPRGRAWWRPGTRS